jgi:hypothetical protein
MVEAPFDHIARAEARCEARDWKTDRIFFTQERSA